MGEVEGPWAPPLRLRLYRCVSVLTLGGSILSGDKLRSEAALVY